MAHQEAITIEEICNNHGADTKICVHCRLDTLKKWGKRIMHTLKELSDADAEIVYKKFTNGKKLWPAYKESEDDGTQRFFINTLYPKEEQDKALLHELIHQIPKHIHKEPFERDYCLNEDLVERLAEDLCELGFANKIINSRYFQKLIPQEQTIIYKRKN